MNALNAAQRMQKIERFEKLTMGEYEALVSVNEQLRQRVAELEKKVAHWKRSHETEVRRARILKERTDMPIERVQAYEQWGRDMAERNRLSGLCDKWNFECDELGQDNDRLANEANAMKQQRDDLLAALEQFATWGRVQHKAQSKGCHATFDMMALKDEIDLAEAAIASVKEG